MKKVALMLAVLSFMFAMMVSAYADQLDGHAEYDATTNILTIPYLDVPLVDPISQQPIPDQHGVYSCQMEYVPNSGGSFSFKTPITYLPNESGSDTHAKYSYDGTLSIPYVDVQTVIVLPFNNVVPGPVETYKVTLKQLMLDDAYFHLQSAVNVNQPSPTDNPVLSGETEAQEGQEIEITINNYSSTAQYTITLDGAALTHDNGVIKWTAQDVDGDTDFEFQVVAQETGHSPSEVVKHTVTVKDAGVPAAVLDNMEYATDEDAQAAYVASDVAKITSHSTHSLTEGGNSLEIRVTAGALGEYVEKTLSPTINLSGKSKIKMDVQSDVPGANLRVGIRNADYYNDESYIVEECSSLTGWTNGSGGGATVTPTTDSGRTVFEFDTNSPAGKGNDAFLYRDVGALDNLGPYIAAEITLNNVAIGSLGNQDYFFFILQRSDLHFRVSFCSDGLYIYDGAANNEVGMDIVNTGQYDSYRFLIDVSNGAANATCDVWRKVSGGSWTEIATDVDCSDTVSNANGDIDLRHYCYNTADRITRVDEVKVGRWGVTKDLTISQADTTETIEWDISGVVDADKDAVDRLQFECVSALSKYPPAHSGTYVKATSNNGAGSLPHLATDPLLPPIGNMTDNEWTAVANTTTNQRFHIDLGTAYIINKIYYENGHDAGTGTTIGAQNFTFWGSNSSSSFDELTYDTDTGWTQITGLSQFTFDQHTASDAAEPKHITITGNTSAYRYYAFKFADNYGQPTYLSVRHIELQNTDSVTTKIDNVRAQ